MSDASHDLIGTPPEWEITLLSGGTLRCIAHSYAQEGGEYVFSLFFDESPPEQFVVLRVPEDLVDTVYG